MCFTFSWKRRENKKESGEMAQGDWVLWAALVEVNSQATIWEHWPQEQGQIPAGKDRSQEGLASCNRERRGEWSGARGTQIRIGFVTMWIFPAFTEGRKFSGLA